MHLQRTKNGCLRETGVSFMDVGKLRKMCTSVTSVEYQIATSEGPFKASPHKQYRMSDEILSAISIDGTINVLEGLSQLMKQSWLAFMLGRKILHRYILVILSVTF